MERTEWGKYEKEKDNYEDLTIVFNSDMTFVVSQSVPFLLDTTGQYVIKGTGCLCEVHFASEIQKHGISQYGTWLWPCWEDQMNVLLPFWSLQHLNRMRNVSYQSFISGK